jgi:predicted translin family RNA/ssDNA-binding protein
MNQKPDQPSANLNLAPIDRFNDLLTVAESKREKEIKISIQSARNLSYAINQLLTRAVEAMQDRSTLKNEVKDLQNPTIEVDGGQF